MLARPPLLRPGGATDAAELGLALLFWPLDVRRSRLPLRVLFERPRRMTFGASAIGGKTDSCGAERVRATPRVRRAPPG